MGGAWEGGEGGGGMEVWGVSGLVVGIWGGYNGMCCLFWRGDLYERLDPIVVQHTDEGSVSTACGEMRRGEGHPLSRSCRWWTTRMSWSLLLPDGRCRFGITRWPAESAASSLADGYLVGSSAWPVATGRDSLGDWTAVGHLGFRLSQCSEVPIFAGKLTGQMPWSIDTGNSGELKGGWRR